MWEHNLVSYEYWESCHPLNWYCDWCVQLLSVFHFTSLTRPHFNEASNLRIRKGKRKRGGEQRKGVNDQGARRAWVKGTTKMLPSAFQGCFLKPCYSSKFSPVILKRRFPGRFYAFFGGCIPRQMALPFCAECKVDFLWTFPDNGAQVVSENGLEYKCLLCKRRA